MAQLYGVDVSYAQGQIYGDTLNAVSNFVMIRSCYGTGGVDTEFARNKAEAHRVQAAAGPLGIGYYHYAYPQYNSPQAEASYFVGNVSDLSKGDVLALDWEEQYAGDNVGWCLQFLDAVTSATGVQPLIYMNDSMASAFDWGQMINGNYGLWLASWDGDKAGSGPST